MKLNQLVLGLLVMTTSFLAHASELEKLDIFELSSMRDKCNVVRSKLVSAGLRANKDVVENTSFLAGFSKDAAGRMLEGAATGQDKLTEALAGQTFSICVFIDKEYNRRLSQ